MHPSHGHDQSIVNGISRIGYMKGGKSALWQDEKIAETLTGKAVSFIEGHKSAPFFLYFATQDAHVPVFRLHSSQERAAWDLAAIVCSNLTGR